MNEGRVLTVAGAKGGVGKSTTSLNLAAALAAAGTSVVVVEADLAMANIADYLSLSVGTDLHEVLAGEANVTDAIHETDAGFDVVPSGTEIDGFVDADAEGLPAVVEALTNQYHLVVVDTGAGIDKATLRALACGDVTVLVSTPRIAAVRDAAKTVELADRVGGEVAGVVFCRDGTANSPPVDQIADYLGVDLLGHVPEDAAVADAQDAGRPVVAHAPESTAAGAYHSAASRLVQNLVDPSVGGVSDDQDTDERDLQAAAERSPRTEADDATESEPTADLESSAEAEPIVAGPAPGTNPTGADPSTAEADGGDVGDDSETGADTGAGVGSVEPGTSSTGSPSTPQSADLDAGTSDLEFDAARNGTDTRQNDTGRNGTGAKQNGAGADRDVADVHDDTKASDRLSSPADVAPGENESADPVPGDAGAPSDDTNPPSTGDGTNSRSTGDDARPATDGPSDEEIAAALRDLPTDGAEEPSDEEIDAALDAVQTEEDEDGGTGGDDDWDDGDWDRDPDLGAGLDESGSGAGLDDEGSSDAGLDDDTDLDAGFDDGFDDGEPESDGTDDGAGGFVFPATDGNEE